MYILGIDPGADGGLAVMTIDGRVAETRRMPGSGPEIRDYLCGWDSEDVAVFVERVGYLGSGERSGPVGVATISRVGGLLEGICLGLRLSYTEIASQTWQKILFGVTRPPKVKKTGITKIDNKASADRSRQWKQSIIDAAARKWPTADLKGSTSPVAKSHSGVCDSLWIAEYGRLCLVGRTVVQPVEVASG